MTSEPIEFSFFVLLKWKKYIPEDGIYRLSYFHKSAR